MTSRRAEVLGAGTLVAGAKGARARGRRTGAAPAVLVGAHLLLELAHVLALPRLPLVRLLGASAEHRAQAVPPRRRRHARRLHHGPRSHVRLAVGRRHEGPTSAGLGALEQVVPGGPRPSGTTWLGALRQHVLGRLAEVRDDVPFLVAERCAATAPPKGIVGGNVGVLLLAPTLLEQALALAPLLVLPHLRLQLLGLVGLHPALFDQRRVGVLSGRRGVAAAPLEGGGVVQRVLAASSGPARGHGRAAGWRNSWGTTNAGPATYRLSNPTPTAHTLRYVARLRSA
jgi:hypothetical protein